MTISYDVVLNFVTKMNSRDVKSNMKMLDQSIDPVVGLKKAFSDMVDLQRFRQMGGDVDFFNTKMKSLQDDVEGLGGDFNRMNKSAKGMTKTFDMSALSLLFFSQVVNRLTTTMFNQMINTFKTLDTKGVMPLNRALTKLEAAFTFLSFTLIKAFEPILIPIIDAIVSFVDWVSQLPDPIKQAAVALLALTAILTGLASAFFTVKLALGAVGITPGLAALSQLSFSGLIASIQGIGPAVLAALPYLALLAIAALLVVETFKATTTFAPELGKTFDGVGNDFGRLAGTLNLDVAWIGTILDNLFNYFDITIQTGIAGVLTFFASILDFVINMITLAVQEIQWLGSAMVYLADLASGKDAANSLNALIAKGNEIKTVFTDVTNTFNDLAAAESAIGQRSNEIIAERKSGIITQAPNATAVSTQSASDFVSSYNQSLIDNSSLLSTTMQDSVLPNISKNIAFTGTTPPTEGPLATTQTDASSFIISYADSMTATAPYLNDTMTIVFTNATEIMKSIVHTAVEATITDVNRAIAALNSLKAAQSSANVSSTTNNANKITINAASTANISKAIQTANIAVPTARL
jgi:hypothetical protein